MNQPDKQQQQAPLSGATLAAIKMFDSIEYQRVQLARREAALAEFFARVPRTELDAYVAETDRIRERAAAQIAQIEGRTAARHPARTGAAS